MGLTLVCRPDILGPQSIILTQPSVTREGSTMTNPCCSPR